MNIHVTPTLAKAQAEHFARRQKWQETAHKAEQARLSRRSGPRLVMIETGVQMQVTPEHYLRLLCSEAGIGVKHIRQGGRAPDIIAMRDGMMKALHARFPLITLSEASRLFNRDRSTIIKIAQQLGIKFNVREGVENHSDLVRSMLDSGSTYEQIGEAIGYSRGAVGLFVRKRGWQGPKETRLLSEHSEAIKAMFDAGYKYRDIGNATGFDASGISRYAKRMGWKREERKNGCI